MSLGDREVEAIRARLRASWPHVDWAPERVRRHAARAPGLETLQGERGDELLHAWACLEEDPTALAEFERRYIADVAPNLRALGFREDELDEVLQRVRERLLVSEPDRPARLSQYAGRGHLGGFVRTVAVRLGIDVRRAQEKLPTPDVGVLLEQENGDPEIEYLKRHYADDLAAALRSAWLHLPGDTRLLLEQQIFDRLSIDDLARMYQLHRATMARRAVAARAALVAGTRQELADKLAVAGSTLDSIVRVVVSQLDVIEILRVESPAPESRRA